MTKSFLAGLLVSLIAIGPGQPRTAAAQAIALETIASGLPDPVGVVHAGDASGRLFIVLQAGQIVIHDGVRLLPTPFLEVGPLVSRGGERGLLSAAFHPDYANNGFFYINYTDTSGDTVVARYQVSADPDLADPASASIVLTVAQPFANHNGGQIAFGPDGFLYIGLGDGGSGGDPGDRAQDLGELLGKLLRIDVDGGAPYAVPAGNPFATNAPCVQGFGNGNAPCPEIFAWGLRNPWRFSFDAVTGKLWAGDVGQGEWEEIDVIEAGENYGWNVREGAHCFNPPNGCATTYTDPITEYDHSLGASITGGYVYRGSAIPDLVGWYVFADFISGRLFAIPEDSVAGVTPVELSATGLSIASLGEATDGELYIVHYGGTIHQITAAP